VNEQVANLASLHTTPQCSMPNQSGEMLGTYRSNDCDTSVNSNEGCGSIFPQKDSYGTGFNAGGGGWYVMKRTSDSGIWVWFWARNDPNVPFKVKSGAPSLEPDASWGLPGARFVPDHCDMPSHFDDHNIIFDLTFCVSSVIIKFGFI